MKDTFISYRPYTDLTLVESMLMSWIISLNDAKQSICFSNEYASKMLKVSIPTITRSVSSLKKKGFINTFQPLGDKRFIHLVKYPEIEVIGFQSCDIEGIVNMTKPDSQDDYTPIHNEETPSSKRLNPLITEITNNKEYKKDNNIAQASYESDLRFMKIIQLFPKGKQMGIEDAYNYTWLFLKESDKIDIEKILPVYIQRNQNEPKYIKPINKYFNEQFWKIDEVSLSLLNKPQQPRKLYF